jgi:hypothetical protein
MVGGRNKKSKNERRRKRDRAVTFGLALLGAGLSFVSIEWACFAWGIGLFFLADWVGNTEWLANRSIRERRAYQVLTIVLVVAIASFPTYRQYRIEMAAETSGYIAARHPQALLAPVIEFGNSGVKYQWRPTDEPLRLLNDAGLSLQMGNDGIEISTAIRDRNDHLVVQIDRNHWFVQGGAAADKNYTDDALEVKDEGGHVVFQAHILSDRVQLRGEWHNAFGGGVQLGECQEPRKVVGCVKLFGPNYPEEPNRLLIDPIFRYPSREYWGELLKP